MQTKDHLALGRFLLLRSDNAGLRGHARAFLLGCVEPDYNAATYMRGILRCGRFHGHNAENSLAHVTKCAETLEREGLQGPWSYFVLGTMLHYVADAFTCPHNRFWDGNLSAHIAYESRLHAVFAEKLRTGARRAAAEPPSPPLAYFCGAHKKYSTADRDMETDCRYIIGTCEAMLAGSLLYAVPEKSGENDAEGGLVYEGAHNNGLVQAGR